MKRVTVKPLVQCRRSKLSAKNNQCQHMRHLGQLTTYLYIQLKYKHYNRFKPNTFLPIIVTLFYTSAEASNTSKSIFRTNYFLIMYMVITINLKWTKTFCCDQGLTRQVFSYWSKTVEKTILLPVHALYCIVQTWNCCPQTLNRSCGNIFRTNINKIIWK